MADLTVNQAHESDLDKLLPLVAAYHEFESVGTSEEFRREAVSRLLRDSALGEILRIERDGALVGYIALCFGYSIEFGGRDAFVDELYLVPDERGRGTGSLVLAHAQDHLRKRGFAAVHLEVALTNDRAKALYRKCGFEGREKYHLMSAYLQE